VEVGGSNPLPSTIEIGKNQIDKFGLKTAQGAGEISENGFVCMNEKLSIDSNQIVKMQEEIRLLHDEYEKNKNRLDEKTRVTVSEKLFKILSGILAIQKDLHEKKKQEMISVQGKALPEKKSEIKTQVMIRVQAKALPGKELSATAGHSQSGHTTPLIVDEKNQVIGPSDVLLFNGQIKNLGLLEIDRTLPYHVRVDWYNKLSKAGYLVKQIPIP
jgi:hypothetical protein